MSEQTTVFLHTGSNQGNRKRNLSWANLMIEEQLGAIVQQSTIYETAAWGVENQPVFLNQVFEITTTLEPELLLKKIHTIEFKLGRTRVKKWAERIIDIDILFYGDNIIEQKGLTIPHPYLHKRKFVLIPMEEIAPKLVHPVLNKTISNLIALCSDTLSVRPIHS